MQENHRIEIGIKTKKKIKIFSYVYLAISALAFLIFCWKAIKCLGETGIKEVDRAMVYANLGYGAICLLQGLVVFFFLFALSCIIRNTMSLYSLQKKLQEKILKDLRMWRKKKKLSKNNNLKLVDYERGESLVFCCLTKYFLFFVDLEIGLCYYYMRLGV